MEGGARLISRQCSRTAIAKNNMDFETAFEENRMDRGEIGEAKYVQSKENSKNVLASSS